MSAKTENDVQDWYLKERGIKPETLEACGVVTDNDEARWKLGTTHKIRTGFGTGDRKFRMAESGHPFAIWQLPVKTLPITDPVIVCEGETDAMKLWQDGGNLKYGMIAAIPGCDALTKEAAEKLKAVAGRATIYFVLDNDTHQADGESSEDYDPESWKDAKTTRPNPARSVDESWQRIKTMIPKARRIYLPDEYKDICAYLKVFTIKEFDGFVVNAEARYHFNKLDLSQPGPPPEYLWDEVIPRSQFVLLQGAMGMGKSLLYQALAVAMANGESFFMGRTISPQKGGRVLIVDEENPEAVIRHRLSQLGLRPDAQKRLHIISMRGVRLDMAPDVAKLYEDVENFDPDLVCLDSFVRFHMQDENNSGAISQMYNSAIIPLSRQLGASVLLLHHVNKTNSGDSRDRTRGSTDITAGVDQAWDMIDKAYEGEGGKYIHVVRFKTRTGATAADFGYQVKDTATGGLEFPLITDKGIL